MQCLIYIHVLTPGDCGHDRVCKQRKVLARANNYETNKLTKNSFCLSSFALFFIGTWINPLRLAVSDLAVFSINNLLALNIFTKHYITWFLKKIITGFHLLQKLFPRRCRNVVLWFPSRTEKRKRNVAREATPILRRV